MVWTHAQNISTQTRRRMEWLKKKKHFCFVKITFLMLFLWFSTLILSTHISLITCIGMDVMDIKMIDLSSSFMYYITIPTIHYVICSLSKRNKKKIRKRFMRLVYLLFLMILLVEATENNIVILEEVIAKTRVSYE